MALLAKSCFAPGIISFISNLIMSSGEEEDADDEEFQEEIAKQSQDKEVIDDEESHEELTHESERKEDMTDDKEYHDGIANETKTLHNGEDATRGESINILSSEMSYFELYNHIENICTTMNMSNITASDVKQKIENELSHTT